MTTIVVTHEDNEVDQFTFDSTDRVITIGRRSSNDVCIPNLSVSGMHARIKIDGESVSIEDNSSTNGTYVNGRLISRQLISDDDEVMIGRSSLVVHASAVQQSSSADASNKAGASPAARAIAADQINLGDANGGEESNAQASAANQGGKQEALKDADFDDDLDDSFVAGDLPNNSPDNGHDQFDDRPMSLSEKAKLALGQTRDPSQGRSGLKAAAIGAGVGAVAGTSASMAADRAFANDDVAVAEAPLPVVEAAPEPTAHPLDGLDGDIGGAHIANPMEADGEISNDAQISKPAGAVIEIQNGAKSGQVLPIDKPVTTLGRPGIQIAAIMRKPDGYFLMHIESDDNIEMPRLNRDCIGDDPVMLKSGDKLNVAGIDVEFMLS